MIHLFLIFCVALIVWPMLLSPGVLLLLDYIADPHWSRDWLHHGAFLVPQFATNVIGMEWGTKGVFIGILIVSGYLGVLFARSIASHARWKRSIWLEMIGIVFFLFAPFSYERMMTQPVVYAGVIAIGYMMWALFSLSSWKRWIGVGIFAGIALNLFLHASYMILLVVFLFAIIYIRNWRDIGGIMIAGILALCINLNWLIAPIFGQWNRLNEVVVYPEVYLEQFGTASVEPLNVWFTNMLLYGFWPEKSGNYYMSITSMSSFWYIAGLMLLGLMIWGIVVLWRASKRYTFIQRPLWVFALYSGVMTAISLIFAIGIASPLSAPLALWMTENIPLWKGYREPQKWTGIIMIIESIWLLIATGYLLHRIGDVLVRFLFTGSIILLILVWSPGPLWGYQGQLKTTIYPSELSEARDVLIHMTEHGEADGILVLPWHTYIQCDWIAPLQVANIAAGLFAPVQVMISHEVDTIDDPIRSRQDSPPWRILSFLTSGNMDELRFLGVDTIVVLRQCVHDYPRDVLDMMPGCTSYFSGDHVQIFSCKKTG